MALLTALRRATHDLHEGLHTHPVLAPLAEENITQDEYGRALQAFARAYEGMSFPDSDLGLPDPGLLARVQEDMVYHCIKALPAAPPLRLSSVSAGVGALYVMNGSSLGGILISRNLEESLGLTAEKGNRFFTSGTSGNWKAFTNGLARVEDGLDEEEVIDGAVQTFDRLGAACDYILKVYDGEATR